MRFTLSFFAVVLLVTACSRHQDSADDKIRKKLPGIWTFEARFASGYDTLSTITVSPDSSYVCTICCKLDVFEPIFESYVDVFKWLFCA